MLSKPRTLLAAVVLTSLACSTVRPVAQPTQYFSQTQPDIVVVTYTDNSQVPVAKPRLAGDTLVGTWDGLGEPVAVPLAQVQRIDARQPSTGRTVMLVAGLAMVTGGGIFALTHAKGNGVNCDYSYRPGPHYNAPRCADGSTATGT